MAGYCAMVALLQGSALKNIAEVLKQKEVELERLKKEVEALQFAVRLLSDEQDQPPSDAKPVVAATPGVPAPVPVPNPRPVVSRQGGYSAAWDNSPMSFGDIDEMKRKGA
jgi:hypothetical protein